MHVQRGTIRRPSGFTLVEVLIAMLLVGVVLSMAMTGFMHSKKLSDLTRSKVIAHDEAARGLQQVALVMKRASIIYFTGVPITRNFVNDNDVSANLPPTVAAGTMDPNYLGQIPLSLATMGASTRVPYNFTDPTDRNYNAGGFWVSYGTSAFRFLDTDAARIPAGGTGPGGRAFLNAANLRLRTSGPTTNPPFDQFFSSPLVYMAEAVFPSSEPLTAGVNAGSNVGAIYPVAWNFYVLYLAPMPLTGGTDAQIPLNGKPQDAGGVVGSTWNRSTVPFQLRLLSVMGVRATRDANARPSGIPATANTGWRRDARGILQAPFDQFQNQVNYHPIEIRMEDPPGNNNASHRLLTTLSTRIVPPEPSGERINGAGVHPNFGNLGNDPPNDTVFTVGGATGIQDRVIANYIDPDNVNGTSVRIQVPTAMTWVNAYNPATGFRYLNDVAPPSRAIVNVTTRYRNNRQIPFQFSSETMEIELEALTRFQGLNYTLRL